MKLASRVSRSMAIGALAPWLVLGCGVGVEPVVATIKIDSAVTASQVKAFRLSVLPKTDRANKAVSCERFFCGSLTNVALLAEGTFAFDAAVAAQNSLSSIAPQKDLLVVAEAFDQPFSANGSNPGTLIAQGCTFGVEVRSKTSTDVSILLRDPLTDAQKGTLCQP